MRGDQRSRSLVIVLRVELQPLATPYNLKQFGGALRVIRVDHRGCARGSRVNSRRRRARAGQVLAEVSVFAARYHCDAVSVAGVTVGRIPRTKVLGLQQEDPVWLRAFAGYLAREVQRARARAELLSLKRVGAKLDAWLALNEGVLAPRGQWVELAKELGVSPEALYRELALRRSDEKTQPTGTRGARSAPSASSRKRT